MAENALELKKMKANVKVTVNNTEVTHLRTVNGGGINLPQMNTTTSASTSVEYSVGRISYNELEITFGNDPTNLPIIKTCTDYMDNPMATGQKGRLNVTVIEKTRGQAGDGHTISFDDAFPTEIELPKATNDAGILETRIRFSVNRATETAGGKSA